MIFLNKFAKLLVAISILITLTASQQVSDEKRPFLRVLAPKYICPNERVTQSQNVSSRVTIGLQTSEGQRMKYSITIDFEILDGFQNQRHTLSIWKHVRQLQAKFATKSYSDEISLKNQIEIDSKELTPQVIYTFRITAHDESNVASDIQNFTITYKGDELQTTQSNIGDGVSLFLFGSESFRNDAEFLAVADVSFCDPINDYSYQWKIDGMPADGDDYLDVRGNVLKLPAGTLEAGKFYEVRVTILNNQNEAIASVSLPVNIFAVEFVVQNVPAACSVGVSKKIPFSALIYRQTDAQNLKIKWTCSDDCNDFFASSSDAIQTSLAFPNEGTFNLKSTSTLNGIDKESSTNVTVNPKVIPHAVMKYFPPQPINTMESNEFVATIMDLVPRCTAVWSLIADEGFGEPRVNSDVTNLGSISIRDYEEHFLNELVDYDNSTLSKDITLLIPSEILNPEEKYKFRLNINCPEPINDLNATDRKFVNTFFDIVVTTNGPPQTLDLEIFPLSGVPMKQDFKFSTGAAKDRQSDYPLKYTFGYRVNNLPIVIGSFFENQVAHTQLPYADSIETFFEVCDNNNACIMKNGPLVSATQSYEYSEAEINFKLDEIKGSLARSEYPRVLNSAVVLIVTQRQINGDSKETEEKIVDMLKNELNQLSDEKSSRFVYQQRVIGFVKMSENLMRIMTINDDEFVENVLSLNDAKSRSRQKRLSLANINQRAIVTRNTDYIKNILMLSDVLLSSPNSEVVKREKKRFVTKIRQFVASLCGDKNLNTKLIQSKSVAFEVSKIYSRHLFNEPQSFPLNAKPTIIFSQNSNFPSKFICMGNIKYKTDVYDLDNTAKDEVYESVVMDNFENPSLIQASSVGEQAIVEMVGDSSNLTDENFCQTWSSNKWIPCEKQVIERTKIICKCKTFSDSVVVKYGVPRKSFDKEKSTTKSSTGENGIEVTTKSTLTESEKKPNASVDNSVKNNDKNSSKGQNEATTILNAAGDNQNANKIETTTNFDATHRPSGTSMPENENAEKYGTTMKSKVTQKPVETFLPADENANKIEATEGSQKLSSTLIPDSGNANKYETTMKSEVTVGTSMPDDRNSNELKSTEGTQKLSSTLMPNSGNASKYETTAKMEATTSFPNNGNGTTLKLEVTQKPVGTSMPGDENSNKIGTNEGAQKLSSTLMPDNGVNNNDLTTVISVDITIKDPFKFSPESSTKYPLRPSNEDANQNSDTTKNSQSLEGINSGNIMTTEMSGITKEMLKIPNVSEDSNIIVTMTSIKASSHSVDSNLNVISTKHPGNIIPTMEIPKKGEHIIQKSTAPIKSVTPASTSRPSQNPAIRGTSKTSSTTTTIPPEPSTTIFANSTEIMAGTNEASVSWTLIIFLLILFLIIIIFFLLFKCRSFAKSQINLPMRQPSKQIKYAKYHDEFTMRG